ncbi:hypothetical protein FSP39_002115 [Pinctada imbricata]|uniref:Uncharacterized protein n=1 Tax=Pinctada imbricata TaxID=66713 RepID=A0AA88YHF7_PINIB|nr:hypothetical protein FSP39_002115 [Pinctada imbricata]
MEQLQSFNESLQSRCVALEQKDTTTAQAQVSMSLSQQEEKFILEQMEKYRKMISDLKQQVLQQGDMLKRQKEAIKKLIAEVQAYRSKQSSLPYREPSEGASFSQPMKDGYTYGYGFHPGLLPSGQVNDFQDMHEARLGMNTFQTLNPQTLEHGKRQTFISRPVSEPPERNNYVKNISPGHKDRDTNTGDLYRGKMTSDDRSRRVSPTNSGNQRISSASDQSVDTGARRKIPQTTQENSPDLRLYENNIATPRNPEPSRGQGHRGVKLEDPQSTYGNFKLSQTMTLEDDYVNIGELDPNRREDQGRAERPTGSVITSEMNVDRRRQPVSSEHRRRKHCYFKFAIVSRL